MQNQFKPQMQASVDAAYEFANISFSQVERLTQLALEQSKINAALAQEHINAAVEIKDPAAAMELIKEQLDNSVKSFAGFAATAFELSQEFQAETTAFAEAHFDQAHNAATKALHDNLKQAPEGYQVAVAAVKSAIEAGNKAIAEARKTAKKSAEFAQESLAKLKEHAPKAAAKPARAVASRRKTRA
ncbi:MAG: phasin family protein [Limnohabitans sp.]